MTIRDEPMLYRGGLSGRVFVATSWTKMNGRFEALRKFDVTDQFNELAGDSERLYERLYKAELERCERLQNELDSALDAANHKYYGDDFEENVLVRVREEWRYCDVCGVLDDLHDDDPPGGCGPAVRRAQLRSHLSQR